MERSKKAAVLFILLGVVIPAVAWLFVDNFRPADGFVRNLLNTGIPLFTMKPPTGLIRLPFRIVLALGVVLIFVGVVKTQRTGRDDGRPDDSE